MSDAEIARLRDERDEYRAAIHGCGCPAPYTECPHDEPLAKQIERLRAALDEWVGKADRLTEERDAAYTREAAAYVAIGWLMAGWAVGVGGGGVPDRWMSDDTPTRYRPMTPAIVKAIRGAMVLTIDMGDV